MVFVSSIVLASLIALVSSVLFVRSIVLVSGSFSFHQECFCKVAPAALPAGCVQFLLTFLCKVCFDRADGSSFVYALRAVAAYRNKLFVLFDMLMT